jgi:hypothetical protein
MAGVPPESWEAEVHGVLDAWEELAAVFRYRRRGQTVELTEVTLRAVQPGVALSTGDLRSRIPLVSWEKAARATVLELWRESEGEVVSRHRATAERPEEEQVANMVNKYAMVAAEYRKNVSKGLRDPVAEIARRHDVQPSTARGWVYRSRKMGHLGKARGRTSGET